MKAKIRMLIRARSSPLPGLLAALALVTSPTRAAVTEAWVECYNNVVTNSNFQPFKAVRDNRGDIIVTGILQGASPEFGNTEMLTVKYSSADGSALWSRRDGWIDEARDPYDPSVAVDSSGNVLVAGRPGVFKYAGADGTLLWEKRYQGVPRSVAVDPSGNVVVTGISYTNSVEAYTVKYAAANGAVSWEQRSAGGLVYGQFVQVGTDGNVVILSADVGGVFKYAAADGKLLWEQGYANGLAQAIAMDPSGDVIVTGEAGTFKYAALNGAVLWTNGGSASAIALDVSGNVVVTKYDRNFGYYVTKCGALDGRLLWEQRFIDQTNFLTVARALAVDGSGNAVVTGVTISVGSCYTAKYAAANGALLWEQRKGKGDPAGIVTDTNGNVVVTALVTTFDNAFVNAEYSPCIAKYAATDGVLLWEQHATPPVNHADMAQALAVDSSGNIVVTGWSSNGKNSDYYTAKYAPDGRLLWGKRYNGPANGYDFPSAVTVDASGNVVVTGSSESTNGSGYYTAMYAAPDGALLWEQRRDTPTGFDTATGVIIDGSSNVVVTGWSATIKYSGDGTPVWTNQAGTALAVDSSGNVVVTGGSATIKYLADGTPLWTNKVGSAVAIDSSDNVIVAGAGTSKYAAADGTLLWKQIESNAVIWAVTVDRSGNVVVAGYYENGAPRYDKDYYTAKYAAADGTLLWERHYNGPLNGDDMAFAVAVDRRDNVIVTGSSVGNFVPFGDFGFFEQDYYTAKYAAVDGALLWEKRYNGPGNGEDGVEIFHGISFFSLGPRHPLAIGPDDSVVVTGTSDGVVGLGIGYDYATVVYRELDARNVKQDVLADLVTLRGTVTNRNDGRQLDEIIRHLTNSLTTMFWVNEIHLERKHGARIFHYDKWAVWKLCRLIQNRKSQIPDAVLQGFVNRTIQADRLLTTVAIDDAIASGVSSNKLEQAQRFLAKGDTAAGGYKCYNGTADYKNAWTRMVRVKISPAAHTSTPPTNAP